MQRQRGRTAVRSCLPCLRPLLRAAPWPSDGGGAGPPVRVPCLKADRSFSRQRRRFLSGISAGISSRRGFLRGTMDFLTGKRRHPSQPCAAAAPVASCQVSRHDKHSPFSLLIAGKRGCVFIWFYGNGRILCNQQAASFAPSALQAAMASSSGASLAMTPGSSCMTAPASLQRAHQSSSHWPAPQP